MQGVKTGLLMFLLPLLAQADNHWNVVVTGGRMRFQSTDSCRVEAGDQQMAVNMGQISSNRFHSAEDNANPEPFDIHFQDCSTTVSQHVGVADGRNPDVLSIGKGASIATGVGIALFGLR